MKKFINFIFILFFSINIYAVSPSFFSGKTYLGDIIPEKGSVWAKNAYMGEWKIMLRFKNSSQVDLVTMLVPTGGHIDNYLSFFTGQKSNDVVDVIPFKYKIEGNTLKLISNDNNSSDILIAREGEALVISDSYRWGFSAALSPYK